MREFARDAWLLIVNSSYGKGNYGRPSPDCDCRLPSPFPPPDTDQTCRVCATAIIFNLVHTFVYYPQVRSMHVEERSGTYAHARVRSTPPHARAALPPVGGPPRPTGWVAATARAQSAPQLGAGRPGAARARLIAPWDAAPGAQEGTRPRGLNSSSTAAVRSFRASLTLRISSVCSRRSTRAPSHCHHRRPPNTSLRAA
jgi:hypothetical protein